MANTASQTARAVPTASLLVPIYNVERYLRECLESAAAQTLQNIEVICINDGSTDGSRAIVEEFAARDPRFKLINKPNSGYGDSMNQGLAAAQGEYVGILESDDIMEPTALANLVTAARDHKADFAKANFSLYWTQPEPREELHEMFRPEQCGQTLCPADSLFIFHAKPSIWSAVYKRSFLEENAIRFLPTPGAAFQDTSFTFKVFALAQRAVYLHESVLKYRQDNGASSINSTNKVFAVPQEYAEIERWLREDYAPAHAPADVRRLQKYCQVVKYDSYMWSYVRLAPQFHEEFLQRMAGEYKAALAAGELELGDLKPWKRANLEGIMANPAAWAKENASYATAGALGRAKHYLHLGGPGLLISYAKARLRHED